MAKTKGLLRHRLLPLRRAANGLLPEWRLATKRLAGLTLLTGLARLASLTRLTELPGLSGLSGLSGHTRLARLAWLSRLTRLTEDRDELPLVVLLPVVINLDRCFFALGSDADNAGKTHVVSLRIAHLSIWPQAETVQTRKRLLTGLAALSTLAGLPLRCPLLLGLLALRRRLLLLGLLTEGLQIAAEQRSVVHTLIQNGRAIDASVSIQGDHPEGFVRDWILVGAPHKPQAVGL